LEFGLASVWNNIGTLAYTLQVCRPIGGSVVFCVGAHLAAVVPELRHHWLAKIIAFSRNKQLGTWEDVATSGCDLQTIALCSAIFLDEWGNGAQVSCIYFCLPAPKGASSGGHAGTRLDSAYFPTDARSHDFAPEKSWKWVRLGEARWGTVRWNLRLELQIPLIFCFGRQTFKLLQNFVLHWWSHTKWFQMLIPGIKL
jgi:hypothetical protein